MNDFDQLGFLPLQLSFDSVNDAVIFLLNIDECRDLLRNICFSNGYLQNVLSINVKLKSDDSK